MLKDPNVLALFAYLAGHAVQYLTTRTLHIPAAVVAKTPDLGTVNDLTTVIGDIAQAAVAAEVAKQIPATPATPPAPPASGS